MAYKEPKILGLMPHWHIRTKNEASWHPNRGYKYMIERSPASGGWEAWIFVPDAPTGVRVSGTVHYSGYMAADEAEADAKARGISGAPNRAVGHRGILGHQNEYGLTFARWLAAAGGRAHVESVITPGITPRAAWENGEDPTEFRAASPARRHVGINEYEKKVRRAVARFGFKNAQKMTFEHAAEIEAARLANEPAVHVARRITGMPAYKEKSNMAKAKRGSTWYVAGYNYPKGHRDRRLKYSGGKFASKTDATHAAREGRREGFHMEVTTRRPKTWWEPTTVSVIQSDQSNRAGGSKNSLSAPTRVATFAQLGHEWDPSAFYSVKGGKIYERQRIGGGGYGRGRLSKAKWVGAVPGFKKSLFYSVVDGVVVARKRK